MKKFAILVRHVDDIIKGEVVVLPSLLNIKEGESFLEVAYKRIMCDTVDVVRVADNIDIWVDEEGFLELDVPVFEYELSDWLSQPIQLAGRLLVTKGADAEGNTVFFERSDAELVNKIAESLQRDSRFIGYVE